MNYLLSAAVLLITFDQQITAIDITCAFSKNGLGYLCDATNIEITSRNDRTIKSISGNHQPGMSNEDVRFFRTNGKTVNFMPRNLESFFPQLEVIQIMNSKLGIVTMDDFKPFGANLKKVWFNGNLISIVDADLFKHNPNLEFIAFFHTKVKHVENGAFDHLKKLTTLHFEANLCHNANAVNNRAGVLGLIEKIQEKCKDFGYAMLRDEITELNEGMLKMKKNLKIVSNLMLECNCEQSP